MAGARRTILPRTVNKGKDKLWEANLNEGVEKDIVDKWSNPQPPFQLYSTS